VAEIASDGTFEICLQEGARCLLSRDAITAQLVYKIQRLSYLNPDVIANITNVQITNVSKPCRRHRHYPPTTKLAVCYIGGYQCEMSLYATGLDVPEKLAALHRQLEENMSNKADYDVLRIDQYGVPMTNSTTQALGPAQFHIFTQAQKEKTLRSLGFAIQSYGLDAYCGMLSNMDSRTMVLKMLLRY
jgi:hypothetical protein